MKNLVTFIAALGIIFSAVPSGAVYAAETAQVSAVSEAAAETTDIEHLAGQWKLQSSDTELYVNISPTDRGTVVINKDGTFDFTGLDGKTISGKIEFSIETIGGTPFQCISLYDGEERVFGGYYHSDDPDIIYYGNNCLSRLVRMGSSEVKLDDLAGNWKYQEAVGSYPVDVMASETGTVEINSDGTYKLTDTDGVTETGKVYLGDETVGGTIINVLRFYNGSELRYTASYHAARPDELYIGNGGRIRLVREADKKSLNTHAIEKMDAYTFFDKMLAGTLAHSSEPSFRSGEADYYRVADYSLFKSLEDIRSIISRKFTGEVKEYFLKEVDSRFIEKDNILYENEGIRGSLAFNTAEGVAVSDVTADRFTATTVAGNGIQGKCKAVFVLENGGWKMSSFTTGDFKNENAAAVKAETFDKGDANCDGTIDMSDAVLVMQALANPDKYGAEGTDDRHITAKGIVYADADDNGLTVNDALRIQQYLLGEISSLT